MGWGKDAELNYNSDKKMCLRRSEQRRLKVTHGLTSFDMSTAAESLVLFSNPTLLLGKSFFFWQHILENNSDYRQLWKIG